MYNVLRNIINNNDLYLVLDFSNFIYFIIKRILSFILCSVDISGESLND